MSTGGATLFAAGFAALYAAHQVADHWVQTSHQAAAKGRAGWPGRLACAAHVATYTLTQLAASAAVFAVAGVWPHGWALAAGLGVSAVSHYWADRRTTLARLASALGLGDFYRLGAPRAGHDDNPSIGTGAYALDQSLHIAFLFLAALIFALGV